MPKGQYQRRATEGLVTRTEKIVFNERGPEVILPIPAPDPEPAQVAVEQAEAAVSEAEDRVEELSLVDVGDCLKVGDFVGKGNRQISNTYGEFLVNPETGKVIKCL